MWCQSLSACSFRDYYEPIRNRLQWRKSDFSVTFIRYKTLKSPYAIKTSLVEKNISKSQRYLVQIRRSMGACPSPLIREGALNFERQKFEKKSTNKLSLSRSLITCRRLDPPSKENKTFTLCSVFTSMRRPPTPHFAPLHVDSDCRRHILNRQTQTRVVVHPIERWTLRGDECWSEILIVFNSPIQKIEVQHDRSKGGM